jgi:hypothetical protein
MPFWQKAVQLFLILRRDSIQVFRGHTLVCVSVVRPGTKIRKSSSAYSLRLFKQLTRHGPRAAPFWVAWETRALKWELLISTLPGGSLTSIIIDFGLLHTLVQCYFIPVLDSQRIDTTGRGTRMRGNGKITMPQGSASCGEMNKQIVSFLAWGPCRPRPVPSLQETFSRRRAPDTVLYAAYCACLSNDRYVVRRAKNP